MKIVLMGTGPFAVPSAQALIESEHEILGLVTRPVPEKSKRRKPPPNPMRELGEKAGLTIWDPPSVNEQSFVQTLAALDADLFVVCDYGQILSNQCLAAARLGGINLHGSLLPKYRGAAPINWAIYHGETILGVSIIHMTPRLDGGPILATASREFTIENAIEIEATLSKLGVEPMRDAIKQLANWDGQSEIGEIQDQGLATKAPRLTKTDGIIDFNRTAKQIQNQVRAFQPWPGTYTYLQSATNDPLRLQIHQVEVIDQSASESPGTITRVEKDALYVACASDQLNLLQVQPAGKRAMAVADFLRGHTIKPGDQFDANDK